MVSSYYPHYYPGKGYDPMGISCCGTIFRYDVNIFGVVGIRLCIIIFGSSGTSGVVTKALLRCGSLVFIVRVINGNNIVVKVFL